MIGAPMTPTRLVATFNCHPTLTAKERDWLSRKGVPAAATSEPTPLRVGFVVWHDPDRFSYMQHSIEPGAPTPTLVRVILILVPDCGGDPVDAVAWHPETQKVATWLGAAWALGQDDAFAPRISKDGGLPIWRSPLEWLRAGRRGLVILQPRLAANFLCDAGPVIAMDVRHGRELRTSLARPGPRILVPERAREAA